MLFYLSNLLKEYYNKEIEFNIVGLKNITFNNDILAKILTKKLEEATLNPIYGINDILGKLKFTNEGCAKLVKPKPDKEFDFYSLVNKYKDNKLTNILNSISLSDNLNELLNNNYKTGTNKELKNIIFENIKYKNLAGIRLRVKGRLTRRYRADRAIYKLQ